ncbi:hypothetical protein K438DRAFT_1569305, partial [Mycena galopus ATCC 62051]
HLDESWICSPSAELLLWLPSAYKIGLWTPHTQMVIGKHQQVISFNNSVYGSEWKNCYVGPEKVTMTRH